MVHGNLIPPVLQHYPLWYKQYKQLHSGLFTYANSARALRMPYYFTVINGKLERLKGSGDKYEIKGWCLNPPFQPSSNYPHVAIMFEHKETFETVWFHYELEADEYLSNGDF